MTPSPAPENSPQPSRNRRLWLVLLSRVGLPVIIAAIAGGSWYGWKYINENLAPIVQTNLSQLLKRPVQIGKLERVTLTGLRFGKSSVPATKDDRDRVEIEAIEVSFNLWQLLSRKLDLDLTLFQPNLYLDQDKDGSWVKTEIEEKEDTGPISTELKQVRFKDAQIELDPFPKAGSKRASITFVETTGDANFFDKGKRIAYELEGKSKTDGKFNIKGETINNKGLNSKLNIRGQNFLLAEIDRLVKLPVNLLQGRVNGAVEVQLPPDARAIVKGTADFKDVTLQIPNVPQLFSKASGKLQINDTLVTLETTSAHLGSIPLIASGKLDAEKGYDLTAKVKSVTLKNFFDTFEVKSPFVVAGTVAADVKVTGSIDRPILSGSTRSLTTTRVDQLDLSKVSANFRLDSKTLQIAVSDVQATPTVGGQVTAQGTMELKEPRSLSFDFKAQNMPGDAIAQLYNANPGIKIGRVNAQGRLSGGLENVQTVAQWQAPEALYPGSGEVAIAANGNTVLRNSVFQVAGGTVRAAGSLTDGRWQGVVQAAGIDANQFAPNVRGRLNGEFQLAGTTQSSAIADIQANGEARLEGNGSVIAKINSSGGRWQSTIQADDVQVDQFAPGVEGRVSGDFKLAGTTDFKLANVQGDGQARLTGGIGNANAKINLNNGRWQADTQIAGIQLRQFSSDLRGQFSGDLRVAGAVDSFNPADIRANGRVRLSEGISLIEEPITAQVAWDGRKVNIQEATARGFSANGSIFADLNGTPTITKLDLNVKTFGYALAKLPIPSPPVTQITGLVDLDGKLTGTPVAPNVSGNIAVRGFSLNGVAFDPNLNGKLQLDPSKGFSISLAGGRDQLALALSPTYQPISLDVRRGEGIITGRARGNRIFNLEVKQLAIEGFLLPGVPIAQLGGVGGKLSGNFNIDLSRQQVIDGVASVADLRLGSLRQTNFSTRFVNNNNVFQFAETTLAKDISRYTVSGSLDLRSTPKFKGNVAIAQGKLEDILQTIQVFQLEDFMRGVNLPAYGGLADLKNIVSVGNSNATLFNQLKRLSEVTALLNQRTEASRENRTPELADVRGTFDGKVSFSAALDAGVQAEFNLAGQNIQWRPYRDVIEIVDGRPQFSNERVLTVEKANLIGSFEDGKVNLDPLLLQSGETTIRLAGNFGGKTQQGQLSIANLPVEEIDRFYPLPLGITGKLNSSITVSGERDNPYAIGEISLVDGTLNNTPIQQATGQFEYLNARLSVGSNIAANTPEPIRINGTIPYRLPFVTRFPDTDQIDLTINVKNEGLAFLNLLTPQVAWQGGQGEVNLKIAGRLFRPVITGAAVVKDAKIAAQALPEPLTGVTGTILFDNDRIRIEQPLQGQFSRGQVAVQGVLPLLAALEPTDPDNAQPLSVSLNRLAINLKGLYQGAVNGSLAVSGSAFAPELSGDVRLTDGKVLLSDTAPATGGQPGAEEQQQAALRFNNLKLVLGNGVQILRAPIINFTARGELLVNGAIDALEPSGTITLNSGQVNVFTTQFVLARGYPQTARFSPQRGLDPELDIRLIASVPEVTRNRAPSNLFSSEVTDDSLLSTTSLGALQTVRIQARATGPASQLFNNLELTSSPGRNREEIIALIGGGFVNTLGRGDSTLGIANLAGSALLTNIQGFIGNTLGLSEFRLFPTLLKNEERRESSLGLAAELGINITGSLSASVLRVLTSDQPTQVGIRYRINDNLLFRGSTDFSGDNRGVFEFETRF